MTQTTYTDSLKMSLLKPLNTAQECELLGGRYFIRRLSALALLEQEEKATQAFEAGDMRQASLLNVQMLLDCLCDPEGLPIPSDALPTADALMARCWMPLPPSNVMLLGHWRTRKKTDRLALALFSVSTGRAPGRGRHSQTGGATRFPASPLASVFADAGRTA